jgi:hypothetical protein
MQKSLPDGFHPRIAMASATGTFVVVLPTRVNGKDAVVVQKFDGNDVLEDSLFIWDGAAQLQHPAVSMDGFNRFTVLDNRVAGRTWASPASGAIWPRFRAPGGARHGDLPSSLPRALRISAHQDGISRGRLWMSW